MGHAPPPVAGACVSAGAPARLLVQFTTVPITARKKCTIPRKIISGQTNSWLSEILPPHHMKPHRKPLWGAAQGGEADKKPVPTRELLACPPVFLYVPGSCSSSQYSLAILPLHFAVESSLPILLGQGQVTFISTQLHSRLCITQHMPVIPVWNCIQEDLKLETSLGHWP